VLTREAVDELEPHFELNGSSFGFEMMLLTAHRRLTMVQVPVKYQPRVGESSVTGDRGKAVGLGLELIRMCIGRRVGAKTR
jgi:dolichol-phosphate mannosyltransferase